MAKHNNAVVEAEKNNVTPITSTNIAPDYLTDFIAENEADGVSTAQEDNLVPLVYVLQGLSPQVNRRNEGVYLEGAEPGDLWLRNAPQPVVKGMDGLSFQPCAYIHNWNEWIPRDDGGGFIGVHDKLPKDATEVKDPENPKKIRFMSPRGTEYVETRSYAGRAYTSEGVFPYLFPFSSTGHSTARLWMSLINRKVSKTGARAPIYTSVYKLTTRQRKNKDGEWFVVDVADERFATAQEALEGKLLAQAFAAGEKKAAAPDALVHEEGEDNTPF